MPRINDLLARINDIAAPFAPRGIRVSKSEAESAAIWKGRKAAFGAMGQKADAYLCMDGVIPTGKLPEVLTKVAAICAGHRVAVSNVFHAGDGNLHPLILFNPNDPEELARAEMAGADIPEAVRRCRRLPHRRAWCRHREARPDDLSVHARRPEPADGREERLRSVWLMNPAKVFPLEGRPMPAGLTCARSIPLPQRRATASAMERIRIETTQLRRPLSGSPVGYSPSATSSCPCGRACWPW